MANFQFGQDNVGSNWQVPSWYVQGMSQSPMAASIAGIGNSIAAFTSGYQAAKQAERGYQLEQQQMGLRERQIGAQESEVEMRKKLIEQQAKEQARQQGLNSALDYYYRQFYGYGQNQPVANSPAIFNDSGLTPATPSRQQVIQSQYGAPIQYNPEAPLFPQ